MRIRAKSAGVPNIEPAETQHITQHEREHIEAQADAADSCVPRAPAMRPAKAATPGVMGFPGSIIWFVIDLDDIREILG